MKLPGGAQGIVPSERRRRVFLPLTGLRAPLAVWVVLFHFERNHPGLPAAAQNLLGNGYVSVGLFFHMSGLLAALSLGHAAGTGSLPSSFVWKRCCRLYPALWASVALGVLAEAVSGNPALLTTAESWLRLGGVLAAAHAWVPSLIFDDTWNGPSWSVSCEVFFTVAAVVLGPRIMRLQTPRACLTALLLLYALLLLIPLAFRHLDMHNSPLKFLPILRLPQFLCGFVLGHMHSLSLLQPLVRPVAAAAAPACLAALAAAAALAPPFAVNPLYPFFVSGLFDPLASVLLACLTTQTSGSLHRVLSAPPLCWLGERCYSLYLLQSPARRLVGALGGWRVGDPSAGSLPPWALWGGLLPAAVALHALVESRFRGGSGGG